LSQHSVSGFLHNARVRYYCFAPVSGKLQAIIWQLAPLQARRCEDGNRSRLNALH
jgi:hypothetical protein